MENTQNPQTEAKVPEFDQNMNIVLNLQLTEIKRIGAILGKQPYENVANIVGKLQMQVNQQTTEIMPEGNMPPAE